MYYILGEKEDERVVSITREKAFHLELVISLPLVFTTLLVAVESGENDFLRTLLGNNCQIIISF